MNELAALKTEEIVCLFVDNNKKINTVNLALHWKDQIHTFYLARDAPSYNDYDFPALKSNLAPGGDIRDK